MGKVFSFLWQALKAIGMLIFGFLGLVWFLFDEFAADDETKARRERKRRNKRQVTQQIQNSSAEHLMKEFGQDIDRLMSSGKLSQDQQNVLKKVMEFDTSEYQSPVYDTLEEDELETLILLLLILLDMD